MILAWYDHLTVTSYQSRLYNCLVHLLQTWKRHVLHAINMTAIIAWFFMSKACIAWGEVMSGIFPASCLKFTWLTSVYPDIETALSYSFHHVWVESSTLIYTSREPCVSCSCSVGVQLMALRWLWLKAYHVNNLQYEYNVYSFLLECMETSPCHYVVV